MKSLKAIFRRQKPHDDLSRASSVSNLDSSSSTLGDEARDACRDRKRVGGLSKTRKTASKDQLEHQQQQQTPEKMPADEDDRSPSRTSCQMTNECLQLQAQVQQLHDDIARLKICQEQSILQIEHLTDENTSLRNKLRDVVHSPLSDNEKQLLLLDSQRQHNSAPASIAPNVQLHSLEIISSVPTTTSTSEWDKQSTSNVSDVSVACLQDKINQMQETHYSTNEELQATLQELTDLQRQVGDLHQDNERLLDEKNLMFDSLCRQTERLNEARDEIESLKHVEDVDEHEKLLAMVTSVQEERAMLLAKLEQNALEAQEVRDEEMRSMRERLEQLETTLEERTADNRQLVIAAAHASDAAKSRLVELEVARSRIVDLEVSTTRAGDDVVQEKDALEVELVDLREQVAELVKAQVQIADLQEECRILRNNAKCTRSELEYKMEVLTAEKETLVEQMQRLDEAGKALQMQMQNHIEDKRQLNVVLSEAQRSVAQAESRIGELEYELGEQRKRCQADGDEWEKFQNDLLTSVRVANDFKNEAQQELQAFVMENKQHRERIRQLEAQLEAMKEAAVVTTEMCSTPRSNKRPTTLPTSLEEMSPRRASNVLSRQNSRQSVKSLIESIENAAKPLTKSTSSPSSSTASLSSITSDSRTPPMPPLKTPEWPTKMPLKEQTPANQPWSALITDNLGGKTDADKEDEQLRDNFLTSRKGIDYVRRNSYSDACERKDPLKGLIKNGGSRRNALLKWCQNKTVGYRNIDITNFSSSWNDGLGFCAILHSYLPEHVPYDTLLAMEKRRNFSVAFKAAESVGITTTLNINEMVNQERPDWQQIMNYVTAIYIHFEA